MTMLAILCSGQGFQGKGMFDLVAAAEAAQPVFAKAAKILGQDPRELVAEGDEAVLHTNLNAQVLCCTQALAAWAVLEPQLEAQLVVAGYSVGEVAAWGVAGALDADRVLDLVARRARLMDEATKQPAGLAAVRDLSETQVQDICQDAGVYVAIRNAADRFVIGGSADRLERAIKAIAAGGTDRVKRLAVNVPSHTPLLHEAAEAFTAVLRKGAHPRAPKARLVSGIDGGAVFDVADGLEKLGRQIGQTVDWAACLDACRSAGANRALELGPGSGLSRMMVSWLENGESRSLADFRTMEGAVDWLRRR